jgi:hypothetical protein
MALYQTVPVFVDIDGQARVQTVTRTVDRNEISIVVSDEMPMPAVGSEIGFDVRIAGAPATGRGRVTGLVHVEDHGLIMLVAQVAILELAGRGAATIARASFRERISEYAVSHPDARRILERAGGETVRPTAPDTTPLNPREGHLTVGSPIPRSEQRPDNAPHGMQAGDPKPGARKRPRAGRHHWELEDRWRVR